MDVIVLTVLLAAGSTVGFGFLVWKLAAHRQEQESSLEWFRSYSVESYRPMQRLLHQDDYKFLESQPGYKPSIARELRAERKKIFKIYLGQLRQDFKKLLRVGKLMIVEAPSDRSDLADAISRLTFRFYWNLFLVHIALISPIPATRTARVTALLGSLESVHDTLCEIGQESGLGLTA